MPLAELVDCGNVAFTMTEQEDQLHHNNAPAHPTALKHAFFLAKHHITRSVSLPTAQIWLPAISGFSQS
jgi:hypothetical protein